MYLSCGTRMQVAHAENSIRVTSSDWTGSFLNFDIFPVRVRFPTDPLAHWWMVLSKIYGPLCSHDPNYLRHISLVVILHYSFAYMVSTKRENGQNREVCLCSFFLMNMKIFKGMFVTIAFSKFGQF